MQTKKIIAVIFDFDDTLAPDSTTGVLKRHGADISAFWSETQELIRDGWDAVPAYLYKMLEASSGGKIKPFTKTAFEEWGRELPLHNGVKSLFARLQKQAAKTDSEIKVEYYCVSSGIGDILRSTPIANNFTEVWASEFCYHADGKIAFPKKVISFTDKTRYIFQISKGFIGDEYRGDPLCVNRKIKREDIRIPFEQMIFVGDGLTDVPCFSLVMKQGGKAIGVYDKNSKSKWKQAWNFVEDGRVKNLHSADYGARSDLSNSLAMAVDAIAASIKEKDTGSSK